MYNVPVDQPRDAALDLKSQILEFKKQLSVYKTDNQLLKVKIRKLNEDVSKRDKQISTLINPNVPSQYKRIMSEKQASLVFSLSQETEMLKKMLAEKEQIIRKLQNELKLTKSYINKPVDKKKIGTVKQNINNKLEIDIPYYDKVSDRNRHLVKSSSLCEIPQSKLSEDKTLPIRLFSAGTIMKSPDGIDAQTLKTLPSFSDKDQTRVAKAFHINGDWNNFDKEPLPNKSGPSHEEIQELQDCFFEVIAEVDQIKHVVGQINGNCVVNSKINLH